jgi:polysaccharide biosynthesis transport protein
LQALETLRAQLRDSEDRVRSDQQQKVYFQSMMASYAPTVDLDTSTTGSVSASQLQIQKLETSLGQLRARYGPAYPDVHKLQAQLEELKKRAAEEDADRPRASSQQVPRTVHNPVLESQLAKLDDDIKTQQKLQQDLQPQIEFHMSKLERIPIVEQQMADLMRDYDTVRTHYLAILDKKLSADTANSLEKRQKGERFFVLEPAQTPQKPFAPNRLLIGLAGVIGGLAGGIGLAILREMTDSSVRNEHEAASIAGGPVLVSVPAIFSEKDLRTRLWQGLGALSGTAVAGLALGYIASSVAGRLL